MVKLNDFKKYTDWVKLWSGRWSLHSDSHFGHHWTVMNKIDGRPAFSKVIYIYKNKISDCWASETIKANLGTRLLKKFKKNNRFAKHLSQELKTKADAVFEFIKNHSPQNLTLKNYNDFWRLVGEYYLPHLKVKYSVDYLSTKELKQFLPVMEDARLYAEPVFRDIENFWEAAAKNLAVQSGYTTAQILATTKEEIRGFFRGKNLPSKMILDNRLKASALCFNNGNFLLFAGKQVKEIENIVMPQAGNEIHGQTAYPGKITGIVKIVFDPQKEGMAFKTGEILVTGMTRPEFLPLMKKAAGFITDAGGILSHAAIVAREMKKPCVIGTRIATKIFKDGDIIELDANKGIVKLIKKR